MTDYRPAEDPESLLAINTPHFYCGVIVLHSRVIKTASSVHYLSGWDIDRVQRYAQRRGWRVAAIPLNGGGYEPST